ncbi:hypothetical protein ACNKHS_25585 [Shigella flexneri]
MTRQRQRQFVLFDATAVVTNADELCASAFDIISMRVAPASRLFSTSSFTTDAGRSTTSPAAIWFAKLRR